MKMLKAYNVKKKKKKILIPIDSVLAPIVHFPAL